MKAIDIINKNKDLDLRRFGKNQYTNAANIDDKPKTLVRIKDLDLRRYGKNQYSKAKGSGGGSNPIIDGHEAVDLRLPSGTLWATMNVGANSPEEYGDYYAWGEIETKSDYSWNTYTFGSNSPFSKYNIEDKLTELELSDDAAHTVMGGNWHMPTESQLRELIDNTTNGWVTVNGVNGCVFTSKVDSSKSIFIPAGGYRKGTSVSSLGSYGNLWSSSLVLWERSHASHLRCFNGYIDINTGSYFDERQYGRPIRGVVG